MDEISAGLAAIGPRRLAHPHRAVRARTGSDARHRVNARADAAPARRPARERPDDRVRPQQPRRSRGATTTPACSSSPKPATYPSAGRAAPASATTARRRSSPAPSTTAPTRSNPPPTAAHSSAAHGRTTTWCSTCDRRGRAVMARGERTDSTPGVPRHRAVGGVQRRGLRHHHHPARSGDQATGGLREPAAWPPRALAVLSRLRASPSCSSGRCGPTTTSCSTTSVQPTGSSCS